MSQLIEITCPDPRCGRTWWMDYEQLQAYKDIYKTLDESGGPAAKSAPPPQPGAGRVEEYRLRCPNPAHGDYVVVRLRIIDSDE